MSVFRTIFDVFILLSTLFLSYIEVFYRLVVPASRKSVAGRSVLITGAGHGLGRLMALSFARERAVLVLWDINQANNEKTARDVRKLGAQAFSYTVDCSSSKAIKNTAERVLEEVGGIYMLINNAGVLVGEDILSLSERNITQTMNINVIAHFWTIRNFLPGMLEANDGHIVTIASMAGKQGSHRLTDYSASKFAAIGLHEALRDEIDKVFNKPGVQTTVVCPMFIDTGLIHSTSTKRDGRDMLKADEVVEQIVDGVLKNKRELLMPAVINWVSMVLKAVLPKRGWEAFLRSQEIVVPSQTRKEK
ncbi:17-beta-hydroxysteroid dehydrogenase 13-like [Acanthaster planci]|uniref:Short-chain dehydrogenase/reductase 3 n=1 Tax=Acanthaster planci TaxID=133434 RepID=A0A8B7ZSU1_ACAPL|nr:17-beta-hydroxysteroid dehydrogenase 13-like [Acanthaster planci]